jgi:hypothetical protein
LEVSKKHSKRSSANQKALLFDCRRTLQECVTTRKREEGEGEEEEEEII